MELLQSIHEGPGKVVEVTIGPYSRPSVWIPELDDQIEVVCKFQTNSGSVPPVLQEYQKDVDGLK